LARAICDLADRDDFHDADRGFVAPAASVLDQFDPDFNLVTP
jgi:hypothetical protein